MVALIWIQYGFNINCLDVFFPYVSSFNICFYLFKFLNKFPQVLDPKTMIGLI